MNVYLVNKKRNVKAEGIFNPQDNSLIVKAGATVSMTLSHGKGFGSAKKVEKMRNTYCEGLKTKNDIVFSSPSVAANFLTGICMNGRIAWKNENGKRLKDLFPEK